MRIRPRSLRFRVFVVLFFVATAPIAFVWLTNLWDTNTGQAMRARVEQAAREAAAAPTDPEVLERAALRAGVWLRVVADDVVRADVDHETPETVVHRLGDLFFGPDGAPTLKAFDAQRPAFSQRDLVRRARAEGQAAGCLHSAQRRLHVCEAVVQAGPLTIIAAESSRRAVRALYDVRYQLLKLSLFVLVGALLLGAWMAWRIVSPIDALRRQIQDRTEGRRPSTAPIELDRDDEFGDVARSVNHLLAALEARERANEAFVADLVHELKNPVAAIRAAGESLGAAANVSPERAAIRAAGESLGAAAQVTPERAARVSRILADSTRRLDAVVSDLLELARAEAGLHRAERAPLDLGRLVRDLVERLAADERFAALRFAVDAAAVVAPAAEADLAAALGNLLENAAAHARTAVTVTVRADDGAARITIADDGDGVAAADLPRVFDRFFTTRASGTGLGLALARAVVEAHGGSIRAENDGGAIFSVCLPRT